MNGLLADRYEILGLLGSGGMGDVFRARDTRLGREVAIKRMRTGDDESERRFVREAQIQARVEHEHVCKVHEVAWDEQRRPFIVMQLVRGETLDDAAKSMTLEERVRTLRTVAEAVHAAHKAGLIHRDLKPANVLVEHTDAGFRPYVTDFGLARDATRQVSLFTTGLAGTPQYMSPEQSRGGSVDPRTDVWGLGVTLYEILTGVMPFGTGTPYAILRRVQREEPAPPRKLNPAVPRELELIVQQCLFKEPDRRYPTARALADDLRRFLEHEPVLARPASVVYRARALSRRHRAWAASLAVVAVALSVLLGVLLVQRWHADERARLATRFGQDAKEIEDQMRLALALPLHDTSGDELLARGKLAALERELDDAGPELAPAGRAALGRGYLAVRDFPKALEHLRVAAKLGNRSPDAAVALGLAASALYAEELAQARRIPDVTMRARFRGEVDKRWRDEVLRALRSAGDGAEYPLALLRFHEGQLDESEQHAREALRRNPWLYDAHRLLGELAVARGLERRQSGDAAAAEEQLARAEDEYAAAADVGRSDSLVWQGLCGVQLDEIALRLDLPSADIEAPARRALASCSNAVQASPGRPDPYALLAAVERLGATWMLRHGRDPSAALEQAVETARKALRLEPQHLRASQELALSLQLDAQRGPP